MRFFMDPGRRYLCDLAQYQEPDHAGHTNRGRLVVQRRGTSAGDICPAVVSHAASILVAHNHPSGDPYPSDEDRTVLPVATRSWPWTGILTVSARKLKRPGPTTWRCSIRYSGKGTAAAAVSGLSWSWYRCVCHVTHNSKTIQAGKNMEIDQSELVYSLL